MKSGFKRVLVDAGPLIALFNKNDKYHDTIKNYLSTFHGQLISTWPVLTEVVFMLDFHPQVKTDFLKWVSDGAIDLYDLELWQLQRIIALFKKYHDLPADLADTTLIAASESLGIKQILTIDRDFDVYRTEQGTYLENVLHSADTNY